MKTKKLAIANVIILLVTLFAVFALTAHVMFLIDLSVTSVGEAARIHRTFLTITVSNIHEETVIWNYPAFVVCFGVVVNGISYWRSRKAN